MRRSFGDVRVSQTAKVPLYPDGGARASDCKIVGNGDERMFDMMSGEARADSRPSRTPNVPAAARRQRAPIARATDSTF